MELTVEESRAKVVAGFNGQQFMTHLGAELVHVEPGYVEIKLPSKPELTQQHGLFHGGVVATLADNSAGFAGHSLMSKNEEPLSIEFKVNFIAKAKGEFLLAKGRCLKNGRRIKVSQADIYAVNDGIETHCATALVSVMAVEDKL